MLLVLESAFVSVLSVQFLSDASHLLGFKAARHTPTQGKDRRVVFSSTRRRNDDGLVRNSLTLLGSPKTEGRLALLCRAFFERVDVAADYWPRRCT